MLANGEEDVKNKPRFGGPNGNRTRVFGVRGRRPRPLDDGTLTENRGKRPYINNNFSLASRSKLRGGYPFSDGGAAGFVVGLGVWAVRAGSIGRDEQRLGECTESLPKDAGGLGPRPLHEEITAPATPLIGPPQALKLDVYCTEGRRPFCRNVN